MPADIPALIAEGRRLIAAATPGLAVACYETDADGSEGRPIVCLGQDHSGPLMSSDSTQGLVCLTTDDRDRFVFAVNALAALLDVAEAAAAVQPAMQCYRDSGGYHPYRALLDKHDALDAALAALALGPDGDGKEKSNG